MRVTIAATLFCLAIAPLHAQPLPNIILITGDDVGADDLGVYGRPVVTPNLDRLAAGGIRFNNFYVTTSSCSPSRASFWTGKYPHATGAENLHDPLPAGQRIIPGYLREKGYFTGNVGKLHLGEGRGVRHGADQFDRVYGTARDQARPYPGIDRFLDERPKDRPFFLGIGYTEAHRAFGHRSPIPHPHDPDGVWVPPYLPDVPEVRHELAQYYDEINFMDASIGRLLDRLRRENLEENTLIFFFGDNGMPFPRAKTSLYDSGVRVPFLVHWPARIPAGGVSGGLASAVDILPTILEIVGIPKPADVQGESMLAALRDPAAPGREYVFFERNWHNFDDHARGVRWKNLKYVRNFFPDEPDYPASDLIASDTYRAMVELLDRGALTPEQTIFFHAIRPEEALYDVTQDPHEFHNLAHRPDYADALERLRGVLDRWLRDTNDTPPEQRNYHNILFRSGERLYPSRGLPRTPVDFEALKKKQEEEEAAMSRDL